MRRLFPVVLCAASLPLLHARLTPQVCGTYPLRATEEAHLHQAARRSRPAAAAPARPAIPDAGNIAILEDGDGVVARRNDFNLDRKTVSFIPAAANAAQYRYQLGAATYDSTAASSGALLTGLSDDDDRLLPLPFPFPFFGSVYRELRVGSDGHITLGGTDTGTSPRSLGRVVAGPARIAALFNDLDPSQSRDGVHVFSDANRFVASWVLVPEYQDFGTGIPQTFQVRLFPDGRIDLAFDSINVESAVVGIAPGGLQGSSNVVSFATGTSATYSGAVCERFGSNTELDLATAAQKFYQTHDDSYDYLMFYNNLDIPADIGALAFETTLRNDRTGYGDTPSDTGGQYGSAARLQAVLNLGPLSQYPADPNRLMNGQGQGGLTPLAVMAHEAGHLFLSYASVRNENDPSARPMLGRQQAHWSFVFNSEASFMEGERIRDNGVGAASRFTTTGTYETFTPLDQYLMGFRPADEVPATFVATGTATSLQTRAPQIGVDFNGGRRDVTVQEIIQAEGRRTPDHTVAQRRYRFGIILVVRQGTTPSQADLDKLDGFRREFENYYGRNTSNRAFADTSIRRALKLSVFPAAGVVEGSTAPATVSVQKAVAAPLTVLLRTATGAAAATPSVTIAGGATSASFTLTGSRAGVEELSAEPADGAYETAYARIQVAAPGAVRLLAVSGDRQAATPGSPLPQPVVIRLTDANQLPYPGVTVQASVSTGGAVTPASAVTDSRGQVSFRWTPGPGATNQLTARIAFGASLAITAAGAPATTASSVGNAASGATGITPGGLASVYGTNLAAGANATASFPFPETLAGVRVLLSGRPARLLFVADSQINFLVPADLPEGTTQLTVSTSVGSSTAVTVGVLPVSPGIFFDAASRFGAILFSGTAQTTAVRPAAAGQFIEVYGTGLGPVRTSGAGLQECVFPPQVTIGGVAARVLFAGLAPGFLGLYQINVQMPAGVPAGAQPLTVIVNGVRSNQVLTGVR